MPQLFLASGSLSRRFLLEEAQIPFMTIQQSADESACDWQLPLEELVLTIAKAKMDHALLPDGQEDQVIFVLTADTLTQDSAGSIHGKPVDKQDAIEKIKKLRTGARVATGFCLDKKRYKAGQWLLEQRVACTVVTTCDIDIPDQWIETYFTRHEIALSCAGAMAVERYGMLFLRSICGSYSNIIGLPLVELRQALSDLGFFPH